MSQDGAVRRAQERGRYFARIELLEWRLKKISELVFSLGSGDLDPDDQAFSLGRIEELSK